MQGRLACVSQFPEKHFRRFFRLMEGKIRSKQPLCSNQSSQPEDDAPPITWHDRWGEICGGFLWKMCIETYIQQHLSDDLSLMCLSNVFGYSPSYISWLFRMETGETIKQHITRHKLALVRALMRNDALSLDDIATTCGFNSRSYFSRFIRSETGMPPKEYRRTVRLEQEIPAKLANETP